SLRHHDADAASTHLAVLAYLIHHETCSGGRHSEADADIGAGTEYRAVDADHAAVQRDQRPARITWIDRRIGLDVALVAVLAEAASQSADDPRSHRLPQLKRIADRHHIVPDSQPVGVAQRKLG